MPKKLRNLSDFELMKLMGEGTVFIFEGDSRSAERPVLILSGQGYNIVLQRDSWYLEVP